MSQMIEVKTAELSGPALRWAVAQSEELEVTIYPPAYGNSHRLSVNGRPEAYRPDIDWGQGGPLIGKHGIEFRFVSDGTIRAVLAGSFAFVPVPYGTGNTHLIAACRAIVAARLGETISVPVALIDNPSFCY